MEDTKVYSIEIRLTQGLTLEDYKDLADDIESAVRQCNYPVELTYEDDVTQTEDVIVSVDLVEKTLFNAQNIEEGE